jgi:hypothetical protein
LENIPPLELGGADVKRGWASRYWDGCKPTCSWPSNIAVNGALPDPFVIARNCDMRNAEMPTYFLDPRTSPDDPWNLPRYMGTQCGKESPTNDIRQYFRTSVTFQEHLLRNPNFPTNPNEDGAHTCFDMIPVAINDTLAYAFGATPGGGGACGKCFQLQFDGTWAPDPRPRVTHSALKGKTLIVMASNTGHDVGDGQFDIMIPGGGTGNYDCFSRPLGKSRLEIDRGHQNGGLLSSCFWVDEFTGVANELRDAGWNATLEEWQACLRRKCRNVFSNVPNDPNGYLLKGCLWHADWFMATDNPNVLYKEIPCPQYLRDKYKSTIDVTPPPGCISGVNC